MTRRSRTTWLATSYWARPRGFQTQPTFLEANPYGGRSVDGEFKAGEIVLHSNLPRPIRRLAAAGPPKAIEPGQLEWETSRGTMP